MIETTIENSLGWLTFNRPERRNALNLEMWQTLPQTLAQLNADEEIRVIILKGAGTEAFVAGADISEFETLRKDPKSAKEYNRHVEAAYYAIRTSEKPTIAMIQGFCIGGGCAIALNCDLRVAADNSVIGLPPAKLGLPYFHVGIWHLASVLGTSMVREMLFTAKKYNAIEALRTGLIHQCVTQEELGEFTNKYANSIARNAPLSIRSAKVALEEYKEDEARRDLKRIIDAEDTCFNSEDYKEGYMAFLEKRRPVFKGK